MFNSMFDELKEVKYFQEIKDFKSFIKCLQVKAEAYLEPKAASMMELFCEYNYRLTIFAIKCPLKMFDWVRKYCGLRKY